MGYDASKSVQQNPASADQKFVRYGTVLSPLNKQVGSVASDQMDYKRSNANNDPAGSQQQGLGANAQGKNCNVALRLTLELVNDLFFFSLSKL